MQYYLNVRTMPVKLMWNKCISTLINISLSNYWRNKFSDWTLFVGSVFHSNLLYHNVHANCKHTMILLTYEYFYRDTILMLNKN